MISPIVYLSFHMNRPLDESDAFTVCKTAQPFLKGMIPCEDPEMMVYDTRDIFGLFY